MSTIARAAAFLLAGSLVAIVLLAFLVRKFSDGPLGPIPGGPMSGDMAEDLIIQFDHPIGGLIELQVLGALTFPAGRVGGLPLLIHATDLVLTIGAVAMGWRLWKRPDLWTRRMAG